MALVETVAEIAALAEARVDSDDFVTVEEAAQYLNYNRRTITERLKAGKLRGVRIARKWLVERSCLPRPGGPSGAAPTPFDAGQHFRVWQGLEGEGYVRASRASTVNVGPIGPEQELTRPAVDVLKLRPDDLVRLKIEVVDDLEVSLVETRINEAREIRDIHHKVDLCTKQSDPNLESTMFWLYGRNARLKILVRNPTKYPTTMARIRFFGWLMVTERVASPDGVAIDAVTRGWT